MLTVLILGDIVGEPGRTAVITRVPELKQKHAVDFIIVNGENAAGGRGITGRITIDLLRAGVSVITTGDHVWDQKEILAFIDTEPRLLRPAELSRRRTGEWVDRPGNEQGKNRCHQRASAHVYAADFGKPVPLGRCSGDEDAQRDCQHHRGRTWRNYE